MLRVTTAHHHPDPYVRFGALARELAEAVVKRRLKANVADAALMVAICNTPDVGDLLDTWRSLCGKLRQELASVQVLSQGKNVVSCE